jgi:hypothetical protein
MKHSATMSFHKYTFFRDILLWLYLNEQTDFLQRPKVLHFAPEAFYINSASKKNLDYTTTDLFSLADVKADICNLPLKTINDDDLCNHVLDTSR